MTFKKKSRYKTQDDGLSVYDKAAVARSNKVIEALKGDYSPYVKPWDGNKSPTAIPHNPTTGKAYHGGNSLMLEGRQLELQREGKVLNNDARWMTYAQATSVGAQVRKGEKATMLIKAGNVTKKKQKPDKGQIEPVQDNGKNEDGRGKFFMKPFPVFHASQIDGLPPMKEIARPPMDERVQQAREVIKKSGAVIGYGYDVAAYSPSRDIIKMPAPEAFESQAAEVAVALHELGHWSGHSSRLNRPMLAFRDNKEEYAKEELRAELFSYACCQNLGVPYSPDQHVAYIGSWIKLLESDPREIMKASSDVDKMLKFLNVPEIAFEILPEVVKKEKTQEKPAFAHRPKGPAAQDAQPVIKPEPRAGALGIEL